MRYMRSNENYGFSSNRFETTYGSSYNKPYNQITKPTIFQPVEKEEKIKIPDNSKPKIESFMKLDTIKGLSKSNPVINENDRSTIPTIQTIHPLKAPPSENPLTLDYNHMITQIARITDFLFLSGLHAISVDKLKSLGVTLVVSLLADGSNLRLPSSIQSVQINIEDTENANIRRHFDRVLERINVEERRKGKTLVHCMAGISRSSTVVIAYLMRYQNLRLRDAYNTVREKRPYIQPNLGFWQQLIDYERSLFGSSSVTMVPLKGTRLLVPDVTPSILPEILAASPMLRVQSRMPQSVYPFRSNYSSY